MKKPWLTTIFLSFVTCAALSGCTSAENESESDKQLSVVTSFYPMYEFTRQVAGDRADVSLMVSAGEDAHHYEPSAKDVTTVNEADVFVYSSEEMEHWVDSLFNTIENDNLVIARTADGVDSTEGSEHDHHEDGEEPQTTGSITIQGVAAHYHTGDAIELTAELEEEVEFDHWHWYTRKSADEEWVTVPEVGGPEFKYEATEESFEVQAVLFDNEHNIYAQSEPVKVMIDNHGNDHTHGDSHEDEHYHEHGNSDNTEPIEIVGLADHYHTGDVVTLVADLKEEADFTNWRWYVRGSQDEEWEAVSGQETDHFEFKTTGESFEVRAALLDNEENIYAQSEPVSVMIDDHENHDPHIWLDPVLAQAQVNVIRDALIEADPEGKAIYEENAKAFNEELQALNEEYENALEGAENRVFVVQHQAFGYLAERYHLEQVAIGGLSTEVEPSPSRIAEIGNLVKEYDVPVIYYQQGASSAIAETVAEETGTETAVLYDLEVLSEELQEKDLGYLDAMRENLEALQLSIQ
ncbi:metal ABC transporter solute-binding protein, Zn/Mn family [Ureibacillus sp. 179-F W5.1 NHS]|uniref:metal ABC transporter solute-binding protein, Zn/Mn family n=1 Tax=Ureibacillus sp. 179-F W5.1 NHS TaxID=3374297 RepID=UPI00387A340C